MKNRFGTFFLAWLILLIVFNVITFVTPEFDCCEKYTESFWIGYTFITITFLGQLICSYSALSEKNSQKLFYRLSLIKTSYSGLIATFFIGGLCMLLSGLAAWVGIIICVIVLACNILSIVKAAAVVGEVERIDQKVKQQTFFIKSLTVDADTLMARAKSEETKAVCKNVYEAIRYSDPMSNDMLAGVESQITIKFAALSNAVVADDADAVNAAAEEVLILINDRNNKCKLLK